MSEQANSEKSFEQMLREAVAGLVREAAVPPTVNVKGAAELLHTTVRAIYQRRHAGQMPRPLTKRPLVWRTADLLSMRP